MSIESEKKRLNDFLAEQTAAHEAAKRRVASTMPPSALYPTSPLIFATKPSPDKSLSVLVC
jgi:hypothetical protein